MNNKKIRVSIREDMIDKADQSKKSLTGSGWQNVEISIDAFKTHIAKGYPFAHQFVSGRRNKDHFNSAEILVADIDKGMTLEEASQHEFIKNYATFIYTTPSHTPSNNRFRVVFVLDRRVFDANSYESMYRALLKILPTDPNIKSCTQFFFGHSNAEWIWIGNSLNNQKINALIADGETEKYNVSDPKHMEIISGETPVKVRNGGRIKPLNTLKANTSIHCPFGIHKDKNPSAFVKINKNGIHGVECRSCGHSTWVEKDQLKTDEFGLFEKLVQENAGKENSHFKYQGLTMYDHDLETSMERSNFHLYNKPHFDLPEIVPGIHLIKSPKGTGKTHTLKRIVETFKDPKKRKSIGFKDERVILVGHRQTLIRESAENLGLECYLNTTGIDTKIIREYTFDGKLKKSYTNKPNYYAVCLDSLNSRIRLNYEKYGVVIIDESEQVFSHFLSEFMDHPTANFEVLSNLIKQAKYVFCLDADIDEITMTGITACLSYSLDEKEQGRISNGNRHYQKLYCHLNTYTPNDREIEVYTSKNHLQDDLKNSILAGERCYVTSNSKKFIEGLYESFSKVFKDKKFQIVTADRGDDEEIANFLKNIKTEILKYDAVFCSPSIGTGIDITFPESESHIDAVYGFFEGDINTHFDIDQQLARVRHPKSVKVWVNPRRARTTTNLNIIKKELLNGRDIKGLQFYLDSNGLHASEGKHPFVDLLAQTISVKRRSLNRLKENFISHKRKNGWTVLEVSHNENSAQKGKVINKAGIKARNKAAVSRLIAAKDIGLQEYFNIRDQKDKNKDLTADQRNAYKKYALKLFYKENVTEELIELDEEGKMRQKILLFELVTNLKLPHTHYQQIMLDPGLQTELGKKIDEKDLKRVVFLRELFNICGIFNLDTFSFDGLVLYGNPNLTDFVNFIKKHEERYLQLFDKQINQHINERPANQVGALLRLIGLDQKAVKKNKGKNSGPSLYQIDPVKFDRISRIIKRRMGE